MVIIICSFQFLFASPYPGTGTSLLISGQKNLLFSKEGFSLHSEGTQWKITPVPSDRTHIIALYEIPLIEKDHVSARMTVRLDYIPPNKSLTRYIKAGLKDYGYFGIEIKKTKKTKINNFNVFQIDSLNMKKQIYLRQFVFVHQRKAVFLTCSTPQSLFDGLQEECNRLAKNFNWTL